MLPRWTINTIATAPLLVIFFLLCFHPFALSSSHTGTSQSLPIRVVCVRVRAIRQVFSSCHCSTLSTRMSQFSSIVCFLCCLRRFHRPFACQTRYIVPIQRNPIRLSPQCYSPFFHVITVIRLYVFYQRLVGSRQFLKLYVGLFDGHYCGIYCIRMQSLGSFSKGLSYFGCSRTVTPL